MIKENAERLINKLPEGVTLLAAAKTRSADEISEAIKGGIKIIGENYLNDALGVIDEVTQKAEWHFIGHLQRNKVKKVIDIFDMIESVDSLRLAKEIEKWCKNRNKVMSILIEVNSGEVKSKSWGSPKGCNTINKNISLLTYVKDNGIDDHGTEIWGS